MTLGRRVFFWGRWKDDIRNAKMILQRKNIFTFCNAFRMCLLPLPIEKKILGLKYWLKLDPICVTSKVPCVHIYIYVYIWWMSMFDRSACIWMRKSTSSSGSFLIWSLNKKAELLLAKLLVCFFVILFLFIGLIIWTIFLSYMFGTIYRILYSWLSYHLSLLYECVEYVFIYIYIYILMKWFSFLLLSDFSHQIFLKNFHVFMFAMPNCTTKLSFSTCQYELPFLTVHLAIHNLLSYD
jgi:hypothetical protein